jgi:hypothetical protein
MASLLPTLGKAFRLSQGEKSSSLCEERGWRKGDGVRNIATNENKPQPRADKNRKKPFF